MKKKKGIGRGEIAWKGKKMRKKKDRGRGYFS